MTIVVAFLLAMLTVAILAPEISVAFSTEDPLLEFAGRDLAAFRTLVATDVIFSVLVALATWFAEIAAVMELDDTRNHIEMIIVQVEMQNCDRWICLE